MWFVLELLDHTEDKREVYVCPDKTKLAAIRESRRAVSGHALRHTAHMGPRARSRGPCRGGNKTPSKEEAGNRAPNFLQKRPDSMLSRKTSVIGFMFRAPAMAFAALHGCPPGAPIW